MFGAAFIYAFEAATNECERVAAECCLIGETG